MGLICKQGYEIYASNISDTCTSQLLSSMFPHLNIEIVLEREQTTSWVFSDSMFINISKRIDGYSRLIIILSWSNC